MESTELWKKKKKKKKRNSVAFLILVWTVWRAWVIAGRPTCCERNVTRNQRDAKLPVKSPSSERKMERKQKQKERKKKKNRMEKRKKSTSRCANDGTEDLDGTLCYVGISLRRYSVWNRKKLVNRAARNIMADKGRRGGTRLPPDGGSIKAWRNRASSDEEERGMLEMWEIRSRPSKSSNRFRFHALVFFFFFSNLCQSVCWFLAKPIGG